MTSMARVPLVAQTWEAVPRLWTMAVRVVTRPVSEIRSATGTDATAIHKVHLSAFGQPAEADLVDALDASGFAKISLVAGDAGRVIGHVMLSRLTSPPRALALAPLAVLPSHQRSGIGTALVRAAIEIARKHGESAIFVLGDPAFYGRFGFSVEAARPFPSPYAGEHFMALMLTDPPMAPAPVLYPPPFAGLG